MREDSNCAAFCQKCILSVGYLIAFHHSSFCHFSFREKNSFFCKVNCRAELFFRKKIQLVFVAILLIDSVWKRKGGHGWLLVFKAGAESLLQIGAGA